MLPQQVAAARRRSLVIGSEIGSDAMMTSTTQIWWRAILEKSGK